MMKNSPSLSPSASRCITRSLRRGVLALLALGVAAVPALAQNQGNGAPRVQQERDHYKPDAILVKFKAGETDGQMATVHQRHGGKLRKKFRRIRWQVVGIPVGSTVQQVVAQYQADPQVEAAEPDYVVHATRTPNDPAFNKQWDMTKISAPAAWDKTTGSANVVVAVIDTGVDYNHADLATNMWKNPGEIAGNGKDDDGNGYVDDVYGIDSANGDSDPLDDEDHGTHCAGSIGAAGNNGIGISGVNWNVKIMALKFLDKTGSGYDSDAITCLEYAIDMKQRGINIVATSDSWGGGGYSAAMKNAFDDAYSAGILSACAAGNDGNNTDVSPDYPASFNSDGIISVAASDASDNRPYWSNYGATTTDLAAPGDAIYSTIRNNSYATYSGTSMATPHVAGAIALVAAASGGASASQIRQLILNNVDVLPQWQGVVASGGRLNLAKALGAVSPPVNRQPDLKIRNSSESTSNASGDNIYNTTGANQSRSQSVANNTTAAYRVAVQNDGTQPETFVLSGPSGGSGWTVAYFDSASNNITSAVTGAGWTTASLAVGAATEIEVRVTAASPSVASRAVLVTAKAASDSSQTDAVLATTSLAVQPDLLIHSGAESDAQYAIDNTYQSTPSGGQIEAVVGKAGSKTSFKIKLQNDSSSSRTFVLKAGESTSKPAAWSLTYKNSSGKNITSPLRGSGYVTKTLSPGASEVVTLSIKILSGKGLVNGDSLSIDFKAYNDASDVSSNTVRDAVRAVINIGSSTSGGGGESTPPPASAGVDASIRNFGSTDFIGAGVISSDGSGETISQDVTKGSVATFYERIKNTGSGDDRFKFSAPGSGSGWTTKYFDDATNVEITSSVVAGTWLTPTLSAGQTYDVRIEITAGSTLSVGSKKSWGLKAISSGDSTKQDVVKAKTKIVSSISSRGFSGSSDVTDNSEDATPTAVSVAAKLQRGQVQLDFGGAGFLLQPDSATDPLNYTISVDGEVIAPTSISYNASSGIVTIKLPVSAQHEITVEWDDLPTQTGTTISGTAEVNIN
jgi:subtilisin family serine protease